MSESKWASRKLWLNVCGMASVLILQLRGISISDNAALVLCAGMGVYNFANVWQKRQQPKEPQ